MKKILTKLSIPLLALGIISFSLTVIDSEEVTTNDKFSDDRITILDHDYPGK